MAIIDVVRWNPDAEPVYAYRFPETNLSTFTQLIVSETQEAALFSGGRLVGTFGPGKHTLDTENLPILRTFFGLPFGGNNPFTAEVWFVNKLLPLNLDWETDSMRFQDPEYRAMVPLMAKGRYGVTVSNTEKFLLRFVGTSSRVTSAMLTDQFKGAFISRTKSVILQVMQSENLGVNSIGANLERLSEALTMGLSPFWADYGLSLLRFDVTSVDVDDRTPDGRKILEAMGRSSAQTIAGYTWQQDKAFEAIAASGNNSMLGVLLMSGVTGSQGNSLLQSTTNTPANPTPVPKEVPLREVSCSRCSRKFQSTAKFCPHCGDPHIPCPTCGTDNREGASRCVRCGCTLIGTPAPIPADLCIRCNEPLKPGTKFCPACGQHC